MTWGWRGFLKRLLEVPDFGGDDELSPLGRARIRYNNAALVLEASVNAGPYLPFTTGSASAPAAVANIAALSALDDSTFVDGTPVEVNSVIDQFYLDATSTRVVDGITVAATLSGTGRWIRRELPSTDWTAQDTWYIDPAGGDDENDGNTAVTALATWDELRRRFGRLPVDGVVFVNLLGDLGAVVADFNNQQQSGIISSAILVRGVNTVVDSIVISVDTPHDNTTRTFGGVDMGVDVSGQVGRLMRVADGAAAGAVSYALGTGLAGVNTLDTGPFNDPVSTNEVFPAAGDTIEFCTQTELSSVLVKAGCYLVIHDCQVTGRGTQEAGGTIIMNRCSIGSGFTFYPTNYLSILQAVRLLPGAGITSDGGSVSSLTTWSSGQIRNRFGANFNVQGNTTASFYQLGVGIVGISFEPGTLDGASVGAMAFYRTTTGTICMNVLEGAHVSLAETWGREIFIGGGALVANIGSGAMVTYPAANPPDFTPNGALDVGGGGGNLGALPIQTAANYAAIVAET